MKLETIMAVILKNIHAWILMLFKQKDLIVPYKLLIQVTNDCNSKCEYCHIWKINKDNPELRKKELNLDDYSRLFQDYSKDLIWLALSGGEVTIHKDILEIITLAKANCPNLKFVTFTTNGLLPNKALQLSKHIQSLDLDCFVTISLDGDEKLHDKLRGVEGNYQKAFQTKSLLDSNGIISHFGITLSQDNTQFIEEQYDNYQKSLRAVTFVHGDGIYHTNPEVEYQKIAHSLVEIYMKFPLFHLSDIIEKIYLKIGVLFLNKVISGTRENIITCDAGSSSLHIFENGDVSPCMFLPSAGNLKNDSLSSILNSSQFQNLREDAEAGRCAKCWLNCYAPHSMMKRPFQTLRAFFFERLENE